MRKEEAKRIIEDWINKETTVDVHTDDGGCYDGHWDMILPINDIVIYMDDVNSSWTFKGLIKIAYDL